MAIAILFLCGMGNFAMHRAVLDSGHPLLREARWLLRLLDGRVGLAIEFALLAGTMLMVADGWLAWAWGYGAYTALNALSAWLVLTGRI